MHTAARLGWHELSLAQAALNKTSVVSVVVCMLGSRTRKPG
jgi:hypothetical protein